MRPVSSRRHQRSAQWQWRRGATTAAAAVSRRTPAPDLAVGDISPNRYQIVRQLAQTTKHTVYVARHRQWGVETVVKVPRAAVLADPRALQVMEESALRWITLGLHPHVAYCYQVDVIDGIPLLIIEHLEGGSLAPWIADGRTANLRVGLNLAIQICHGLEHAHAREVWHGSLGPETFLLTADGTVRISDFGSMAHGAVAVRRRAGARVCCRRPRRA